MLNKLLNADLAYYRVLWPLGAAAMNKLNSDWRGIVSNNVLSITVNKAGTEAVIKAPSGIPAQYYLEVYDTPPTTLVYSAAYT
jgi:hypothetical protein